MAEAELNNIVKDIKRVYERITQYSEKAQADAFLSYYNNAPTFLHFSSDGKMRNYEAFKEVCTEYYNVLKGQEIRVIHEKIHVIDSNLAVVGWTGNIIALFKNGDTIKLNNYAITSVFKKIDGKWKVTHAHESSLPPEIKKN